MIRKSLLVILIILVTTVVKAQISAPDYDYKLETTYINLPQDTIYVFHSPDESDLSVKGSLLASNPDDLVSTYTWKKFNETTLLFDQELFMDENVTESALSDVGYGGFEVRIKNSEWDTTFRTWVFIDTFEVKRIKIENTCEELRLMVVTQPTVYQDYIFYDVSGLNSTENPFEPFEILIKNGAADMQNVEWIPENEEVELDNPNSIICVTTNPPPIEDSRYTIEITDMFGKASSITSSNVEGKAVYADYSIWTKDKEGIFNEWDGTEGPEGEAPFEVKFINESLNADTLYWKGYNDEEKVMLGKRKYLWEEKDQDEVIYTYMPGTFEVQLIGKNADGCIDSINIEDLLPIKVDTSHIDIESIPNVFTPNGDEVNDIWIFSQFRDKDTGELLDFKERSIRSMKEIDIRIYNRWGIKVYDYEGSITEWQGWDGKSGLTTVGAGIYSYVIKAKGYDDIVYDNKVYSGLIHVFK